MQKTKIYYGKGSSADIPLCDDATTKSIEDARAEYLQRENKLPTPEQLARFILFGEVKRD